ncbi:MAG TPA: type II toxin-antitoxin system death-on-curing family toxin [Edaphobacter sp.]|nr:type II toxin-antitoxin system death-on-curing family toxin [Edaphobacter sp.]
MTEEPEFLSLDDILEIHRDQIERYGGELSIRDRGLLESAVAMPQQSFGGEYLHPDIFEMAAAYAFHLAENQAFVDGNKRTGLAAAYMFLALNGYRLIEQGERLYEAMIAVGTHRLDKSGLAQVLRKCSQVDV